MKLGQYADDTFLTLDGTEKSVMESVRIFENFYQCSGLKLNVDKTQAIWLGTKKFSNEKVCLEKKFNWVKSFNLLGIIFDIILEKMIKLNYEKKIIEIERLFTSYDKHKLSIIGKVTVIKTLAIPTLVYLLSVLPHPGQTIIK